MLHHGGKRHGVGSRQFRNRGLPPAKSRQDGTTGRIGERRKCCIQPLTIVNQGVKCSGSQSLVKLALFSSRQLRLPLTLWWRSLCVGPLLAIQLAPRHQVWQLQKDTAVPKRNKTSCPKRKRRRPKVGSCSILANAANRPEQSCLKMRDLMSNSLQLRVYCWELRGRNCAG
jgi:hypothetical protein